MNLSPKSWLDKLLEAAIVLALSAWLICWAVAALQPLVPLFIVVGLVVSALWIGAAIVRRRRYG